MKGNAIDRDAAIYQLGLADRAMGYATEWAVIALRSLNILTTIVKCKSGTSMDIAYRTYGAALENTCKEINKVFPSMHKSIGDLINVAGGVTADIMQFSTWDYKMPTMKNIEYSNITGIADYNEALDKVKSLCSDMGQLGGFLEEAVTRYKALWTLANDSGFAQLKELVHNLADKVRKIADDVNSASSKFQSDFTKYIVSVQTQEQRTSAMVQQKINAINGQFNDISISIAE